MKTSSYRLLATLVFGAVAMLMWIFCHPALLSHHEETQLFIYDWQYLSQRLLMPGGLAVFCGEFLTQFFVNLWVGSAIIALLLMATQMLTWRIAQRLGANDAHYVLSFAPSAILWVHMLDSNVLISFVVSVVIGLAAAYLFVCLQGRNMRIYALAVGVPLLFVSTSIGAYLFMAISLFAYWRESKDWRNALVVSAGALLLLVAMIVLTYRLSSYELWRVASGIYLYEMKYLLPSANLVVLVLLFVSVVVITVLPRLTLFSTRTLAIAESLILVLSVSGTIKHIMGELNYSNVEYEYFVRTSNWDAILQKGAQSGSGEYFETLAINLALAQKGELTERLFEYTQNGPEGLLPPFPNDGATMILAAEIYLRIGVVNNALRSFFEAQENIMTDTKSGRLMRRIAELSIVNGEYDIAQKYINYLKKTFGYRRWALETENLLSNEHAVDSHPFYGMMRKYRTTESYIYNDDISEQIAGSHFIHNNENVVALDYALLKILLAGGVDKFVEYFDFTAPMVKYNTIPRVYQEALVFHWRRQHQDYKGIPWPVSQNVMQKYEMFINIYSSYPKDDRITKGEFSKTYWGYIARMSSNK